jgi:hypothetical protein
MSSGRDMIADFLRQKRLVLSGNSPISGCLGYATVYKTAQCQRGMVSIMQCKSQDFDNFLVFTPTLWRGSTAFSASLDATLRLTSSCGCQTSRPSHSTWKLVQRPACHHVDITVARIHWRYTGVCFLDAGHRYLIPPCKPIGGAPSTRFEG